MTHYLIVPTIVVPKNDYYKAALWARLDEAELAQLR
jgi:hypothetical protein